MSFVVQRVTASGLLLNQISGDVLRIGRGTNAELRSENAAVALDHAVIESDASGFLISDKGSITGTYVNRKPVESVRLAKGDVIEIGDLRIEVQLAEAGRPLFLRVMSTVSDRKVFVDFDDDDDAEVAPLPAGRGTLRPPKIDYVTAFKLKRPWLTKASLIALLVIIALVVIAQVTMPGNQTVFMPGGVSSAHARAHDADGLPIASNCQACHDPWRGVIDQRCSSCHGKEPHAPAQAEAPPCISCHAEHRGSVKLAMISDAKCVACHANLQDHVKAGIALRPDVAHIDAFGSKHPGFSYPLDADSLRFNHALHLDSRGIFNAEGKREVLQCTGCHRLVETKGKVDPKPLKFAADCQRCHKLTFDAKFPDAEAPHGGDPGLVYGYVLATYAGNRDIIGKSPEEVRRILTTRAPSSPDERAVLNADQVIKTKCSQCHDITRKGMRLAVIPPVILTRWFDHARFSHGTHRNVDCEKCHEKARRSTRTTDVLMPSRGNCVECHAGRDGGAASNCVTCHDYHERSKILMTKMAAGFTRAGKRAAAQAPTEDGEGMLGNILLITIALLLLVVLVPVSIALFQRLRVPADQRPRSGSSSGRMKLPPIPPLPPPSAPAPASGPPPPTEKMAAVSAPAPPPPPPVPHATTAGDTIVRPPEPQGGATELVQWYGMLTCTSGPLEGQRFVVDEDGLYIGRDPALAQVVIADSRVSKRHVRIVPRDGKVHAIDQGSTNGTFMGGQRITDVQLKRGDIIILADNVATFLYQI